MKPFIIGVAGGSGSGKSKVTEQIIHAVGAEKVTVFIQDNFYLDRSHLTPEERSRVNFDHPSAMVCQLKCHNMILQLIRGLLPLKPSRQLKLSF